MFNNKGSLELCHTAVIHNLYGFCDGTVVLEAIHVVKFLLFSFTNKYKSKKKPRYCGKILSTESETQQTINIFLQLTKTQFLSSLPVSYKMLFCEVAMLPKVNSVHLALHPFEGYFFLYHFSAIN